MLIAMSQSWGVAGQLQPALKHTFGAVTVDTAQSQVTFAAAPAANAASIQTADTHCSYSQQRGRCGVT
jgi:hypothetical protein